MTVVVQTPEGAIKVLSKGADSVLRHDHTSVDASRGLTAGFSPGAAEQSYRYPVGAL